MSSSAKGSGSWRWRPVRSRASSTTSPSASPPACRCCRWTTHCARRSPSATKPRCCRHCATTAAASAPRRCWCWMSTAASRPTAAARTPTVRRSRTPTLSTQALEKPSAAVVAWHGRAYWMVVVPVFAPDLVGYIAAAIPVDDARLAQLQRQSALPRSVELATATGARLARASRAAAVRCAELTPSLVGAGRAPVRAAAGHRRGRARIRGAGGLVEPFAPERAGGRGARLFGRRGAASLSSCRRRVGGPAGAGPAWSVCSARC